MEHQEFWYGSTDGTVKGVVTRFKCVACGKLTSGRVPRKCGRIVGDGSFRFPRRHKVNGSPCPGNIEEAEWVDVRR